MTAASTTEMHVGGSERRPDDVMADDVVRVLLPDGTLVQDAGVGIDEAVELYRAMVRTRIVDERAVALQRQGRIGFHIGSLGEEASILGSAHALREQDWLFPCYREFGAALLRGMPLSSYLCNLYGNADDVVKGRQMPDHWTYRAARCTSVSSPIGTQIAQAVGFAWAARIRKDPIAVLVYFGDGATSSNDFHNAMNFAGVYRTPTIFLCRNNGWAISVPTERQTASESFAQKGIAYGVPGVRCDGNDLFAVIKVTREAIARAVGGGGATLIEALTYRLSGHSTSDDPGRYRPNEQLEPWHALDPIRRLRRYIDKHAGWNDAQQKTLEEEVQAEVKAAIEQAESTPPPKIDSIFDDVYAEPPWNLREQREELVHGPRAKTHHG